jgi:Domain of unknown function (DUF4920)
MKNVFFSLVLVATILSCKNNTEPKDSNEGFAVFGAKIPKGEALTFDDMAKKYESLKPGDTANVKFESTINAVCKKKGCWMTMNLGNDKEAFVKFKDYAFFVPKNADKSQAIVSGKAFVAVESIDELKHYAKDAGQSQASIDSIIAPKTTYSFMADAVMIKK